MMHYSILNDATYNYLLTLKVTNRLWYLSLVKCAKRGPKLAAKCMQEAKSLMKWASLDYSEVNIFAICKAANAGLLDNLGKHVDDSNWQDYRKMIINRIRNADKT